MIYTTYTIAQAKREFEQGALIKFRIINIMGFWTVTLYSIGGASGCLVDARTSNARAFKTCDSVISTLKAIGFKVDVLECGKPE